MSANLQVIEHRWGTRIPLEAPALLRTAQGKPLEVVLGNASLSGAFVHTASRLPLLTCVLVRALEGSGDWLEACVVRHDSAGMGLEWLDPGLRSLSALLALQYGAQLSPRPRAAHLPSSLSLKAVETA